MSVQTLIRPGDADYVDPGQLLTVEEYLQGVALIDHPSRVPWGKVQIGYFDCPWQYRVRSRKGLSRSAENHYPTLNLKELAKLPIYDLLDKDAWLFAWVTMPGLQEQMEMITEGWGLTFATCAFTWYKTTVHGKEHVGTGHYTRANQEMCLLFKKGKGLPRRSKSVRQVITAPVSAHSAKPHETYNRIFRLAEGENWNYSTLQHTYLEGFARNYWPGYFSMGLDLPEEGKGKDIRVTLGLLEEVTHALD